jgi:putative OPT family oligopeptide transporter
MVTTEPASPPPVRRELTVRALAAGCVLGAVLGAGNVYTALKTGFIDGGAITAALVAFMFFSAIRRFGSRHFGVLENNLAQTTASSASIMGFVLGLPGPVPAMGFLGIMPPAWAIALWGLAAGVIGIVAAIVLRRRLIVDDALPFPTGRATGEVIQTIYAARAAAMRRALLLSGTAVAAFAIFWFRDGKPAVIPQALVFGGAIGGFTMASLTIGLSWSPLLGSVGAMIGPRGGASVLLGGGLAFGVLAPRLLKAGIVQSADFGSFTKWLVWPALGLLVAGSFVPLLLDVGSLRRSFADLRSLARGRAADGLRTTPTASPVGARTLTSLFLVSVVTLMIVGRSVFGVGPAVTAVAILLALLLTNVSARATGETDVAPVGSVGMITQAAFGGAGAVTSLVTGGVSTGTSSQACGLLYSFRAGERLGASVRAQLGGQLVGAVLGAIVVVPAYFLLIKSYGLGTEALPAASAQSWKAMAEAVRGGALPAHATLAGVVGLAAGAALAIGARTRIGRFLPSPAAMGMAMLIPASYATTIFVGSMLVLVARRLRPNLDESTVLTVAAGGMAGESIAGVLVALLTALGAL